MELPTVFEPWLLARFTFISRRKEGLTGFEPVTHGLGNRGTTVHPVRSNALSVGSDASHSGPSVQFGHKYAPCYAPHKFSEQRSFDVDVFVTVRSAGRPTLRMI